MFNRFIFCFLLVSLSSFAQKGTQIYEDDAITIFESIVSEKSSENLYPFPYKEGLLYTSAFESDYYRLRYSDGTNKPKRVRISRRFQLGPVSLFENEIYFTGMSNFMNEKGEPHLSVLKGIIEDFKVSKLEELDFCIDGYTYAHPNVSKDGKSMVVVTNENDVYHLLEVNRNDNNKWERGEPIFITQLNFKILNPVFVGENTIYFSSNMFNGAKANRSYEIQNNRPVLTDVVSPTASFNIYKIMKNQDGSWTIPVKVDALSSEFDDLGVQFITEKTGYISTYRYDNTNNIFYFELK